MERSDKLRIAKIVSEVNVPNHDRHSGQGPNVEQNRDGSERSTVPIHQAKDASNGEQAEPICWHHNCLHRLGVEIAWPQLTNNCLTGHFSSLHFHLPLLCHLAI